MEGVGEVLAGDQRTWKQNKQGKWHAAGHAAPHQLRAAVIQLKEESEADKAAGRRGKTWQQIADARGRRADDGYLQDDLGAVRRDRPLLLRCAYLS